MGMFKKNKVLDFVPNWILVEIKDKNDKVVSVGNGFYTRCLSFDDKIYW